MLKILMVSTNMSGGIFLTCLRLITTFSSPILSGRINITYFNTISYAYFNESGEKKKTGKRTKKIQEMSITFHHRTLPNHLAAPMAHQYDSRATIGFSSRRKPRDSTITIALRRPKSHLGPEIFGLRKELGPRSSGPNIPK